MSNKCVAPFHDRMPVILQKNELAKWLRDDGYMRTVFAREGPELLPQKAG
jgi:putative SOS response-associated peptidase YedK